MTERDRAVDAFRNCITEPKCKDCPWTECSTLDNGNVEIPRDLALAVMRELVAQEPRVMTWQEIVDAAPQMPFIWLESKENHDRVFQSILFKTWLWDSTVTIITVMTQGWLFEGYHVDYDKKWRCWTSRPDEERRAETPWES